MRIIVRGLRAILSASLLPSLAVGQESGHGSVAPATYTGCVTRLPNVDRYVLAAGGRCMLLSGSFQGETAAGHVTTFRGLLLEPSGMAPLTLEVKSSVAIKNACSEACTLEPPGSRGIHGKEKPGPEGGPPGLKPTPPPK